MAMCEKSTHIASGDTFGTRSLAASNGAAVLNWDKWECVLENQEFRKVNAGGTLTTVKNSPIEDGIAAVTRVDESSTALATC